MLLNSDTATLNLHIDEELLLLSPLRPHDPNKRNEVKYYLNLSEDYMWIFELFPGSQLPCGHNSLQLANQSIILLATNTSHTITLFHF